MEYQRVTKAAQKGQPQTPSSSLRQTSLNHVAVHPLLGLQRSIGNQAVLNLLHSQNMHMDASTSAFRAPRFSYDFSRIPLHSMQTAVPQTKLKVNQSGDVYEQEADQVAEQVMRTTNPETSASDDEDEAKTALMRKQGAASGPNAATESPDVPPIVHTVLNSGGGQPLDTTTRNFMEPRFGHDFSQVRVHTDEQAAESVRAVNALAYTVGRDVVFGEGQYAPGTSGGHRLLAHELTHVVQQSQSSQSLLLRAPSKKKIKQVKEPKKSWTQQELEKATKMDEIEQDLSEEDSTIIDGLVNAVKDGVQADSELSQSNLAFILSTTEKQLTGLGEQPKIPTTKKKQGHADKGEVIIKAIHAQRKNVEALKKGKDESQITDIFKYVLYKLSQKLIAQFQPRKQEQPTSSVQKPFQIYQQERDAILEALGDLAAEDNELGINEYISIRDAFLHVFVDPIPTTDEEFASTLHVIKKFYTKTNFPETDFLSQYKKVTGNRHVYKDMFTQLHKAQEFLENTRHPDGTKYLEVVVQQWQPPSGNSGMLGGLNFRLNRNNPASASPHTFGFAIDLNAAENSNVAKDILASYEKLSGKDLYTGKEVQKILGSTQGNVQDLFNAIQEFHNISIDIVKEFQIKENLDKSIIEYLKRNINISKIISDEEIKRILAIAWEPYKEEKKPDKKMKEDKDKAKKQLLEPLTRTLAIPAREAASIAQFLLDMYNVYYHTHVKEIKVGVKEPTQSFPSETPADLYSTETDKKLPIKDATQGTVKSIAIQGFLNLPDELTTALLHSSGGNLEWLGLQEYGHKDFMHFQLNANMRKSILASIRQKLPQKTTTGTTPPTTEPE
jgi:hypothetical protein